MVYIGKNSSTGNKLIDKLNKYYTDKLQQHGPSPMGVDWNSTESQEMGFEQLCKVIDTQEEFSIMDFGCGYGALFGYLLKNDKKNVNYTGLDINPAMLAESKKLYADHPNASWKMKLEDEDKFDYALANGIFNVKLDAEVKEWEKFIFDSINTLDKHSTKGFAFNILTSYSDKEYHKDHLYYADPCFFFDYCKRRFSRHVALLHDYPRWEFTIIVRKDK